MSRTPMAMCDTFLIGIVHNCNNRRLCGLGRTPAGSREQEGLVDQRCLGS